MSRKQLQLQIISLDKKIKDLEKRQLQACFASATDRPHEDMGILFIQKDKLVVEKIRLQEQLNKPTFIQVITGRK